MCWASALCCPPRRLKLTQKSHTPQTGQSWRQIALTVGMYVLRSGLRLAVLSRACNLKRPWLLIDFDTMWDLLNTGWSYHSSSSRGTQNPIGEHSGIEVRPTCRCDLPSAGLAATVLQQAFQSQVVVRMFCSRRPIPRTVSTSPSLLQRYDSSLLRTVSTGSRTATLPDDTRTSAGLFKSTGGSGMRAYSTPGRP